MKILFGSFFPKGTYSTKILLRKILVEYMLF